jgi:hypothetical protein
MNRPYARPDEPGCQSKLHSVRPKDLVAKPLATHVHVGGATHVHVGGAINQ